MTLLHRIAHRLRWNVCSVEDLPDGHWVVCSGCGEKRFRITSRSPEAYQALVDMGIKPAQMDAEQIIDAELEG